MKLAMMQPTFLPWQGYFALLRAADQFVYLDDFQFCRSTFHHRNRVIYPGGRADWITVPVSRAAGLGTPIAGAAPAIAEPWLSKTLGSLRQSYAKCAHFVALYPPLEALLQRPHASLADLNIALIDWMRDLLGIHTPCARSSALAVTGQRSARVLAILRHFGADTYLSARGAFGYMREDGIFPVPDVQVCFQRFTPPPYPQRQVNDFVPYLSALDALFQVGPAGTLALLDQGQGAYDDWARMMAEEATCTSDPE